MCCCLAGCSSMSWMQITRIRYVQGIQALWGANCVMPVMALSDSCQQAGHGCSHDRDLLMILQGCFPEMSTHSRQTGRRTQITLWSCTCRVSKLLGSLCGPAGSTATANELKKLLLHMKGPLTWNWCHRNRDDGRPGDGSRQLLWILQQGCGWGSGLMA